MTQEASTAPGDGQGAETTSSWLEALPEDAVFEMEDGGEKKQLPLREHPKLNEFKDVNSLVQSFLNQEKVLGKKAIGLTPLAEDADDNARKAWDAEFRKIQGVPEKPEGYEFTFPEGMKADENLVNGFRASAHEAGLGPAQAQAVVDWYMKFAGDYQAGLDKDAETERNTKAAAVTKLWGKEAPKEVEVAKRGFEAACVKAGVGIEEAKGVLDNTGLGDDPVLLRLFNHIGKQLGEMELVAGDKTKGSKSDAEVLFPGFKK